MVVFKTDFILHTVTPSGKISFSSFSSRHTGFFVSSLIIFIKVDFFFGACHTRVASYFYQECFPPTFARNVLMS